MGALASKCARTDFFREEGRATQRPEQRKGITDLALAHVNSRPRGCQGRYNSDTGRAEVIGEIGKIERKTKRDYDAKIEEKYYK